MSESFELMGEWFLPENRRRRISGRLKFAPDIGASLELIGSFRKVSFPPSRLGFLDAMFTQDIVLGISTDDRKITLIDCFETKSALVLPRTLGSTYAKASTLTTDLIFVGTHLRNKQSIRFTSIVVSYSRLSEWLRYTGFAVQRPSIDEFILAYKMPMALQIAETDDFKVSAGTEATGKEPRYETLEANIKEKTFLKFEFKNQKDYQECLRLAHEFAHFLTLAMGSPVFLLDIAGETDKGDKVEVAFKREPSAGSQWLFSSEILFDLERAKDQISLLIDNWFKKRELLAPVRDLYFGTLYHPHMYLYHSFLSLAQAVETYHRRSNEGGFLPKAEYEAKIKTILNGIPVEHQKWVKAKLAFANERTLRERITDLMSQSSDALRAIVKDEANFIGQVVATRNYLTHYTSKKKVAEGDELILLTHKLKLLLEECLLRELGFSPDDVEQLIATSGSTRPQLI